MASTLRIACQRLRAARLLERPVKTVVRPSTDQTIADGGARCAPAGDQQEGLPNMKKQAKSETDIHGAVLDELHGVAACRAIQDVVIEVNWDRPAGLSNWWIRQIKFRNGSVQHPGCAGAGSELARIEAVLQSKFFASPGNNV